MGRHQQDACSLRTEETMSLVGRGHRDRDKEDSREDKKEDGEDCDSLDSRQMEGIFPCQDSTG